MNQKKKEKGEVINSKKHSNRKPFKNKKRLKEGQPYTNKTKPCFREPSISDKTIQPQTCSPPSVHLSSTPKEVIV